MYREKYPVEKMCKVLQVSRSAYYNWFNGKPSKRTLENEQLLKAIKKEFDLSKQTYGSPKITEALQKKG
ncbi:hypothetical protein L3X37_02515 [Sabulilitoribacter arenilitoris]|uniref:HTH-like domain-containing protein n=1 Tax=Wocania arenilitoris TaxID=2044858 RepID=A0AAE3EN70_9FLAO|nr:IS3 family transposase [Wocania arenilitoris]MCF7567239.1 hypothetical protein [Wocania arenilitoris]